MSLMPLRLHGDCSAMPRPALLTMHVSYDSQSMRVYDTRRLRASITCNSHFQQYRSSRRDPQPTHFPGAVASCHPAPPACWNRALRSTRRFGRAADPTRAYTSTSKHHGALIGSHTRYEGMIRAGGCVSTWYGVCYVRIAAQSYSECSSSMRAHVSAALHTGNLRRTR